MIKKIFILLLSLNLFAVEKNKNCTCSTRDFSTTEKGIMVSAAILTTPYIFPAGTIGGLAAAVTTAAHYLIPTTIVGKISLGLTAVNIARPMVVQTTEEKLDALIKERASNQEKARIEFIECLKSNKKNSQRNESGRPIECEDLAFFYALNSSATELNKRTEAFNKNKCFCS